MKQIKQLGFTLIELLVVIAIIGILSAVVLVSLNSARAKSRDARRLGDVRQVMTALELFYNDNSAYPTATAGAPTPGNGTPPFSTFMQRFPVDPTNTAPYVYTYAQTGGGTGYTLSFVLEGASGGFSAGTHSASPAGLN